MGTRRAGFDWLHLALEQDRSAGGTTDALQVGFCFAPPCHSWERGLNETAKGLVHQYFPGGTELRMIPA
ncbi:MAG: hypothetical protein OXF20_08015 [Gammaproteobacteria bacterium]|nr:hypothetical protein [Gammaproteobacteria bacterium]